MAGSRKLQAEITQCLKKIEEGMVEFDDIWEKVYSADTQAHKERWEAELKKEIKKLQRFRDQIKGWLSSTDIKDKSPLIEARKNVEGKMEQFKICERETKTKAYSREGLAREAKVDPREQEKEEKRQWLGELTDQLNNLVESLEADLEKLQGGKMKGKNREAAEVLSSRIKKNKWHILKLEQVKRLMDNDELEPSAIEEIRDDIDYYVESAPDDDGNTSFEEMLEFNIYEVLNLDANPLVLGMAAPGSGGLGGLDDDGGSEGSSLPEGKPSKGKKGAAAASTASAIAAAAGVSVPPVGVGASPAGKAGKGAAVVIGKAGAASSTASAASKATAPAVATTTIGTKGAVAPAAVAPGKTAGGKAALASAGAPEPPASAWAAGKAAPGTDAIASSRPTAAAIVAGSASTAPTPPAASGAGNTPTRSVSAPEAAVALSAAAAAPEVARSASVASSVPAAQTTQTTPAAQQSPAVPTATQPVPTPTATALPVATAASATSPGSSAAPANVSLPPRPAPAPLTADQLVSLSMLGASSAMSNPPAPASTATAAGDSTNAVPAGGDKASSARAYAPRTPYNCHASFPTGQPSASICENPKLFERFNYDTLFLVFYYQQGSYQQYLAAKQLKKLGWRYHRKYMTWFQRHEEPKAASEAGEEGTYIYFDYEAGWCQRIKHDFKFEYAYLEDEI